MNTNVLKLFSLIAFAVCMIASVSIFHFGSVPMVVPEARSILAWQPDFAPNANSTSTENSAQSSAELSARPIFAPSRRPFVPPAPIVAEPPPQLVVVAPEPQPVPEPELVPVAAAQPVPLVDPNQFELKGIMQSDGIVSAFVVTPEAPDGTWLTKKSEIMGWTMARIDRNSIVLTGEGREVVLQQYVEKPEQDSAKKQATAPAAQAIPPPQPSN